MRSFGPFCFRDGFSFPLLLFGWINVIHSVDVGADTVESIKLFVLSFVLDP